MTEKHPVTPPDELVVEWSTIWHQSYGNRSSFAHFMAAQAAHWASDQELEACCSLALEDRRCGTQRARDLLVERIRERRRPKPPSLVKRALYILGTHGDLSPKEHNTIRQALEHLDD